MPGAIPCQAPAEVGAQNANRKPQVSVRGQSAKRSDRICVLVRGQYWSPPAPGCACRDRIHSHCSRWKAEELVAAGAAEWIKSERTTRGGKVVEKVWACIRLVRSRRWMPTPSAECRSMKTLQLVG